MATVDAGSTATYTYDALGQRVEGDVAGNPENFYLYDPAGNLLNAPFTDGWGGDELTELVAGRVLASYVNGRSDTYFKHPNALGSWGLATAHDGSVPQDQLYYPWGQTWTSGHYLFEPNYAAMTWYNAESDLFLTPARSYGSRLGRWMSPDPLGGDVTNPQSLNRYAYVLNNPASMVDPSGLDPAACQDPMYASSHAECVNDPECEYFSMECGGPWGIPPGPAGGESGGQTGGAGVDTGSTAGIADGIGTFEDFLGTGCIAPSFLTRLAILAGTYAARLLNRGGSGQTKSVSWGFGGSVGGGVGLGPSASVSWYDTVDIYGNAAQVSTYQISPLNPAVGIGGVAGVQLQKSNGSVPTTPQSSNGWGTDPTYSIGGGAGWGANIDVAKSGTTTLTVGVAAGGKGVATSLLPIFAIIASMPYCGGGNGR